MYLLIQFGIIVEICLQIDIPKEDAQNKLLLILFKQLGLQKITCPNTQVLGNIQQINNPLIARPLFEFLTVNGIEFRLTPPPLLLLNVKHLT